MLKNFVFLNFFLYLCTEKRLQCLIATISKSSQFFSFVFVEDVVVPLFLEEPTPKIKKVKKLQ